MRSVRLLLFIYALAIINILSTLLPAWPMRYALLTRGLDPRLLLAAQDVALFAGVTMLLLAYPAAEGHRRAAHFLMLCTGAAILAHLLKGLDVEEALFNGVLLLTLWRGRARLHRIPLRYTPVDLARLALVIIIITRAYIATGHAVLRGLRVLLENGEGEFPWLDRMLLQLSQQLRMQHMWFHESQLLLPLFLLGIFLIVSWTSLRQAVGAYQGDDLYERFGRASHNSLAYLARRNDVSTFLDPAGHGAISYRIVGHVALQIGAILAPAGARAAVYQAFLAYCKAEHLIPAAVALDAEERAIARQHGMRSLAIGTEAVVDLKDFAVEALNKKMRWVQRSLSKRGFGATLLTSAEIPTHIRVKLDGIDEQWRAMRGGQAHGFCMTLGRFPRRDDTGCLVGVASDATGAPVAYLTLLPGGEGYYSLDLTRRSHNAPNAIMEYLVIETLRQLKERGATKVSLNFSTFSSLSSSRAGAVLLRLFGRAVQLQSLETFNAKFRPSWAPRYALFPSWYSVPDVVYAIAVVEGLDRMLRNALRRMIWQVVHPTGTYTQPKRRSLRSEGVQGA